MNIVDELNARIERGKASDRELARITGQTIAELDADTTRPDPFDALLEREQEPYAKLARLILRDLFWCDRNRQIETVTKRDFFQADDVIGVSETAKEIFKFVQGEIQKQNRNTGTLLDQLEQCQYECEAGPLELNVAFLALKELVAP